MKIISPKIAIQMSILAVFAYSAKEQENEHYYVIVEKACNRVTLVIVASLTACKERFPRTDENFRVWR